MIDLDVYKYKYDLHVHTSPVSPCGDFSPAEVVDKYIALGYNGVVITNHFQPKLVDKFENSTGFAEYFLKDYQKAKKYGNTKGFDVILGIEMRFPENDNDYLVYGVSEDDVYRMLNFVYTNYESFYKEFKNEKNLVIQAHPFRKNCVLQNTDILDGIEIFNLHPGHNSAVGFAAKKASENPHLLKTGGTDFHHETHQGMCATLFKERIKDSFRLAEVLKSRDYILDIWGNKITLY